MVVVSSASSVPTGGIEVCRKAHLSILESCDFFIESREFFLESREFFLESCDSVAESCEFFFYFAGRFSLLWESHDFIRYGGFWVVGLGVGGWCR